MRSSVGRAGNRIEKELWSVFPRRAFRAGRISEVGGHFEKFHPWNFCESQSKNAILALLHVSNSYLFETLVAYPCAAGHFELVEAL